MSSCLDHTSLPESPTHAGSPQCKHGGGHAAPFTCLLTHFPKLCFSSLKQQGPVAMKTKHCCDETEREPARYPRGQAVGLARSLDLVVMEHVHSLLELPRNKPRRAAISGEEIQKRRGRGQTALSAPTARRGPEARRPEPSSSCRSRI